MLILAFDTTVAACSVAICNEDRALAHRQEVMSQGQAEALMPMIQDCLKQVGTDYAEIDRIAVTTGPGSFTGVRVGIAAARGIALAAAKPVIGVPTTEVLALGVPESDTRILSVIDTKRGDLYAQMFNLERQAEGPPQVIGIDNLFAWVGDNAVCVVGDGAEAAVESLGSAAMRSAAGPFADTRVLARIAASRAPSSESATPIYARAPEAKLPAHGGRLRT